MSQPVQTTPEADAQIRAASFAVIGQTPNLGRVYRRSPVPSTRRVLLKGTRYHVYYVLRVDEVRVLAVWHAQRGVGPPLHAS